MPISIDLAGIDYAILAHYFPPGLLGLGFTALMASFMAGMAGNVTAFNTVWTYDIYHRSLGINVNLWWGGGLLIFGLLMLFFALRKGGDK